MVNLLNARLDLGLKRNPYDQQRQRGHYDLVGVPWMAIEVKRYRKAMQGDVRGWWIETCLQADLETQVPVLAYRADQQQWRFVVPLGWITNTEWRLHNLVELGAELTTDGFVEIVRGHMQADEYTCDGINSIMD